MSASGESFINYRRRLRKNDNYHTWRVGHKKTFYVPHHNDAKTGGYALRWDTPVDTALRLNIRRYDVPALGDED